MNPPQGANSPTTTANTPDEDAVRRLLVMAKIMRTTDCKAGLMQGPAMLEVFEGTLSELARRSTRIAQLEREHAQLVARVASLEGALGETTEHLAELIKDEYDDPSVGIVGWTGMHERVAANRALLSPVPQEGQKK